MILKRHAKKIFTGLFALVLAFVMTGCGSNPLLKAYQDALATANTTLAEAKDLVAIPGADAVAGNLTLPSKVVREDWEVQVSWASSNPAVVSTAGVVNRAAANTAVTLTATLDYFYKYGGTDTPQASVKVSDSKVFALTVLAAPVAPTPVTVADVVAAPIASNPDAPSYLVQGIVVAVNLGGGFFVQDATNMIYVYSDVVVQLGDEVRVNGHRLDYYKMPQMGLKTSGSAPTTAVTIVSSNNPIEFNYIVAGVSIEDFHFLDTSILAMYGQLYNLMGKVTSTTVGSTVTYFVEDPFTGRQAEIYGGSSGKDSLADYVDKYVVMSVIPYNFHDGNSRWRVVYSQFTNSIYEVAAPSNADFAKNALNKADLDVADEMIANQTVQLPEAFGGATFSYALAAGELKASLTGNALTAADAEEATSFNLFVTATRGNAQYTMKKEIAVGPLSNVMTVAQFKASDDLAINYIRGDVVAAGGASNNYFWIRDAAGDYLKVDDPLGTSAVGDKVILQATKKTTAIGAEAYADAHTLIARTGQGAAALADPSVANTYDYATLNALNADTTLIGKYIKVTGFVRLSGTYYNLYGNNTDTVLATNIQLFAYNNALYQQLYSLESQQVDIYAFVHSLTAATAGKINLSIQKIVNNNPDVLVNELSVANMTMGVGESVLINPVFNANTLPRPTNRAVTYEVAVADASKVTVASGVLHGLEAGVATVTATSVADPSKTATFTVTLVARDFYDFNTVTGGSTSYDEKVITTTDLAGNVATFNLTGVSTTTFNNSGVMAMGSRNNPNYYGRTSIATDAATVNLTKIEFDYQWWSATDAGRQNLVTEFKVYIATDAAFTTGVVSYDVAYDATATGKKFSQVVTPGTYYVKIVFESTHAGSNGCRMVIDNFALYR